MRSKSARQSGPRPVWFKASASLTAAALVFSACFVRAGSVRDYTRLFRPDGTALTQTQASELTLTLTDVAVRPIQTWVRTAGALDSSGKTLTTLLHSPEAEWVQIGQRLRAFPIGSRTQMHQGRVSALMKQAGGITVEATLADQGHDPGAHYVMEIVVDRGEFLSIPNVSIIEEGDGRIAYVQKSPGHYAPRVIRTGIQGENYTQIIQGLAEGDQVVSIGSFFVDAEYKLKASGAD